MIIKLDKGDTQEIFKEFVDEATREYINSKIKSLFDKRVERAIEEKIENIDLDKMIKGQLGLRLDKHFKSKGWNGEMEHVNKQIDKKLEEMNFDEIVKDKFTEEVATAVWNRMRIASKAVEKL